MKKESVATGGAIGASLLVASCCLAPAVFLLFGVSVGALGILTSLEPYRPLFIALGGAALVYAAWRAWRPDAAEACTDGSCAPNSPGRRRTRRLLVLAMVLYGLAISYPYVLQALL
jgi:mercuric ion transport protein